jgi:tetratricopeptide (TPR) repeat protein
VTKPRVFIGSSVEGLNVAYSVQQNLLHDAEVTVWDQGIFQLSATTIESLSAALSSSDFGIFVFSPDDLLRIRDTTSSAVRDNVLFEFGLFIGRLGRERVYFLIPSGSDLRLPTDLMGVTPGKYDAARSDGSMQAATGGACHQIRLQVRALGPLPTRIATEPKPEGSVTEEKRARSWVQDFFEEKFDTAKSTLEEELKTQTGDEALATQAWILYCDAKHSGNSVTTRLINFASENSNSPKCQTIVASILRIEGHTHLAFELLTAARSRMPGNPDIAIGLSMCRMDSCDDAGAISDLLSAEPDETPEVAISLADILEKAEKKEEALRAIQRCYARNPSNRSVRFKYARLAQELGQHEVAAYLLHHLTSDKPDNADYWGYLGNTCLQLDLPDTALSAYRSAEAAAGKGSIASQWIVSNIGNLLNNRRLPSEACGYFEQALKLDPRSDYAHDRLAMALKNQAAETKSFEKMCAEGKKAVRAMAAQVLSKSSPEPADATSQAAAALLASIANFGKAK